jgi:hypothetical protein
MQHVVNTALTYFVELKTSSEANSCATHSENPLYFMEHVGSLLPHAQKPATGPCAKPR